VWILIAATVFFSYLSTPFLSRSRGKKPKRSPLVSIIIPAKDEEDTIEKCLRSLVNQDYKNLEIIVIDDRSTDRTFEICKKIESEDSRVKVLQIHELPAGWTGKNHAAHEGAKLAGGELYLFIDADTDHDPQCVTSSIYLFEEKGLDALSVEPYFAWTNFFQELTFSIFTLFTACLFPIFIVNRRGTKLTLSNGQYILLKKETYRSIGGHEAIKGEILEDLALMENVKKKNLNYNLIIGTGLITVKMYRDMASFWQGWGRILFLALNKNLIMALVLYLLSIIISIFPFLTLIQMLIAALMGLPVLNPISILGLSTVIIIILTNTFVNSFFKINPLYSLLHPLAIIGGMAVMGNSISMALHRKEIEWKGTTYKIPSKP
jgi:chlorobactene glucosyltransferase